MLTRHELLVSGAAAGLARAAAPQPRTKVSFAVPAGGCDCAVHIFGDPARYPLAADRTYTPETATADELRAMMKALGLTRVVITQATPYGTDNSCMLDAVRSFGGNARGIAMIAPDAPDSALDEMHRAGVRGLRLNFRNLGVTDPAAARRILQAGVERASKRNWLIHMTGQAGTFEALRAELMAPTVSLVIDHFGSVPASGGVNQPAFRTLLDLLKAERVYVKISGAELIARDPAEAGPLAKALVAANPRRILWGTQWPHPSAQAVSGRKATDLARHNYFDDAMLLNLFGDWVPSVETRRLILAENPAKLYGF